MNSKHFILVDEDFFPSIVSDEYIINWYATAKNVKDRVTIRESKTTKGNYVLYCGNTPEWTSSELDGIYAYIANYLNSKSEYKIFSNLNDAFQYICYNLPEDSKERLSKKVSVYEFLLEYAIGQEKK